MAITRASVIELVQVPLALVIPEITLVPNSVSADYALLIPKDIALLPR